MSFPTGPLIYRRSVHQGEKRRFQHALHLPERLQSTRPCRCSRFPATGCKLLIGFVRATGLLSMQTISRYAAWVHSMLSERTGRSRFGNDESCNTTERDHCRSYNDIINAATQSGDCEWEVNSLFFGRAQERNLVPTEDRFSRSERSWM